MIQIPFSKFRNSDFSFLVTQLIAILSKFSAEVRTSLSLDGIYMALVQRKPDIDLALDKNRKNPHTNEVELSDNERDDAILAFKLYLLYCTKQQDETIKAAAEKLIDSLQTIGWSLQQSGNNEQSKQVKAFIAEVDNQAHLSNALALCSCEPMYDRIKSTQSSFDAILEKFNAAETQRKTIDPVQEKAWIRQTIDDLLLELNYHARKDSSSEAQTIALEVDALVDNINTVIRSRMTRAKNMAEQ
jgi:hypothetical protein